MPDWIEPFEGFVYTTAIASVEAAHQADKLSACGLAPDVFGDHVDPSFFIGLAIKAGIDSGITAEGNVNMVQSLEQLRPVRLGEELTVRGEITQVARVPRGRAVTTEVRFEDAGGATVIRADRVSLKPDPDSSTRGAGERPPPVVGDARALTRLERYQLTPERVKDYSSEGNSIHYEMDAARAAGFRAPLIGGGMGVHYLVAALWPQLEQGRCALDIYFRRPIFWDEAVHVARDTAWSALALLKEDKVGTEIRVNSFA